MGKNDLGLFWVPGGSNGVRRDMKEVCWNVAAVLPIKLHLMLHVELPTFVGHQSTLETQFWGLLCRSGSSLFYCQRFWSKRALPPFFFFCSLSFTLRRTQDVHLYSKHYYHRRKIRGLVQCATEFTTCRKISSNGVEASVLCLSVCAFWYPHACL